MRLMQFLNANLQDKSVEDYQIQVNYKAVALADADEINLEDGDIVRLSKPLEIPMQWIVGEEEE